MLCSLSHVVLTEITVKCKRLEDLPLDWCLKAEPQSLLRYVMRRLCLDRRSSSPWSATGQSPRICPNAETSSALKLLNSVPLTHWASLHLTLSAWVWFLAWLLIPVPLIPYSGRQRMMTSHIGDLNYVPLSNFSLTQSWRLFAFGR